MPLTVTPLFVEGSRGRLFGLHVEPEGMARGALLYLPPFAEEMNRCRALVAEQARQLATQGFACLLLDPFGTGDSAGELEDASLDLWEADAAIVAAWLAGRHSCSISLWGLRLGALIAGRVFEAAPADYERLLLWQPVTNGKQFLTQYLRLRVAWLMERGLPAETTDGIRAALATGASVEVAGYPIAGALARSLDAASFPAGEALLAEKRIDWLENSNEAGAEPSIAARRTIAQLEARGAQVVHRSFQGPPLWQLHKRDELPALIEVTSATLKGGA